MLIERIKFQGQDIRAPKLEVVLTYLVGYVNGDPHLLFVRRGDKVANMKNMWSTLAGFRNGNIDIPRQALVEIAGETSLLRNEVGRVTLVGTFEDEDKSANKIWVRHITMAFLNASVKSADEFGVRLDWEHSEAAWVPVKSVINWLDGHLTGNPTADAILFDEDHTPDFELNFGRVRSELEKLVG